MHYGLTSSAPDVNQAVVVAASKVTIWGVAASPSHNLIRGTCLRCLLHGEKEPEEVGAGLREGEMEGPVGSFESEALLEPTEASEGSGGCSSDTNTVPLLTNPVTCGHPRSASAAVDSCS